MSLRRRRHRRRHLQLRIPMRGYEGVMCRTVAELRQLRIPMRGYERRAMANWPPCAWVTNPHEGL